MTGRLKIFALALGLAVAGGSIAQAATTVTDTTVKREHVHVVKHVVSAAELRKHRLHLAHLRHIQKLHESRLLSRHQGIKTVKVEKTVKVTESKAAKDAKTVLVHHAMAKPATVIR
jgi:hypothetical protein